MDFYLQFLAVCFFALGMAGYPCCCVNIICDCCESGTSPQSYWLVEFANVTGGSEFCADCSEFNGVSFEIPVEEGLCSNKDDFDTGLCNISVGVGCGSESGLFVFFEVGPLAQSETFVPTGAIVNCEETQSLIGDNDIYCNVALATATIIGV